VGALEGFVEEAVGQLSKEAVDKILSGDSKMSADIVEDPCKGSKAKGVVVGNANVMLSRPGQRKPHVTTALPGDRVADSPQRSCQVLAGEISREPQTAMTCSRVKWSLTTRGTSGGSK
jgi:hypothetical protein